MRNRPHEQTKTASTSGSPQQQQQQDPRGQIWWQVRPQQSAPPRQSLLSKAEGRFINEEVIGLGGGTRAGRATAVGSDLDIPQVEPFACYFLLAAQLGVYALGTWVGATQGLEAAAQMAEELAMVPAAVLAPAGESEWWRLGSCLLLHTCVLSGARPFLLFLEGLGWDGLSPRFGRVGAGFGQRCSTGSLAAALVAQHTLHTRRKTNDTTPYTTTRINKTKHNNK